MNLSKVKNNQTNKSDESQQNLESQIKSVKVGEQNKSHNTKKESQGPNTKR